MLFVMYFVVALVLGQLVSRIRWQERADAGARNVPLRFIY